MSILTVVTKNLDQTLAKFKLVTNQILKPIRDVWLTKVNLRDYIADNVKQSGHSTSVLHRLLHEINILTPQP